jgi:hypothetical protein
MWIIQWTRYDPITRHPTIGGTNYSGYWLGFPIEFSSTWAAGFSFRGWGNGTEDTGGDTYGIPDKYTLERSGNSGFFLMTRKAIFNAEYISGTQMLVIGC